MRILTVLALTTLLAAGATAQDSTRAAPLRTFAALFSLGPAWDMAKPPQDQPHFRLHSANLARLRAADVIVTGGRFGEYGLILVRAPAIDSARAMFANDSTVVTGVFKLGLTPWSTIYEGAVKRP